MSGFVVTCWKNKDIKHKTFENTQKRKGKRFLLCLVRAQIIRVSGQRGRDGDAAAERAQGEGDEAD